MKDRGPEDESRFRSPRCGGMRRKKISGAGDGDDVNIYEKDASGEEGKNALSALIGSIGLLIPSPREGVETRAQAARRMAASNEAPRPQACIALQPGECSMSRIGGSESPCQSGDRHVRCIGEDTIALDGQECHGTSCPRDVPCTPKHQIVPKDRVLEPPEAPKKTRLRHSLYEDGETQIPPCLARQLDFDSEVNMLRSDSDETRMT